MSINGYWWRIYESSEGIVAQSGPHTEHFIPGTSLEEVAQCLTEWY